MIVGPLVQIANAAPAKHTPFLVEDNQLAERVALVFVPFLLDVATLSGAIQESLVLKGTFSAFIAYRTVKGVIRQEELQVRFASLDGSRRSVDFDGHALTHGRGARGLEPPRSLDLYQAHAAGAYRHQLFMMAKGGDVNAGTGGCFIHGAAFSAPDLLAVYCQMNRPIWHKREPLSVVP
jgi:hypothetical protein